MTVTATHIRHAIHDIGHFTALDEQLTHQIVDTFATTISSDHSWTEKVWIALARKDGTLALDFGLGRYHNRGVMDGWAAVSRGRAQWTVRATRELRDDPTVTKVGPLFYDVREPYQKIRAVLERNDAQPIAYDITFIAEMLPFFENRHRERETDGFRVASDVVRYHQVGTASGWVEIDGQRIEIDPKDWIACRDHSWGVRQGVGAHAPDIRPTGNFAGAKFGEGEYYLIWSPFMLVSPGGERTAYHVNYRSRQGQVFYSSGYRNLPDGRQETISRVRPELRFDDRTRRLLGGTLHFDMQQGDTRSVSIEVCGESAVHLGPGLYLGFDGRRHGSWEGALHVDGDHFADTQDVETLKRIRQIRDCPIRVREGDSIGYGIMETIVHGAHPAIGLTAANSLL